MDELIEAAKKNYDRLFVMGLDQEELGRTQWIREIEGSGPVEVLLLQNHPHFENVKGTRAYMLKTTGL
jgi:hypothetical protein